MTGRTRLVGWGGLGVVLAAAAVLSFDALRGLALAVTIPAELAWLLPIAVDAGAAVSCAAWLSGRVSTRAARFARAMTVCLLATTVIANASQLGLHAYGIAPPWWVAVLVGAIPPAIVGGVVHLAVLVAAVPAAAGDVSEVITDPVGSTEIGPTLDIDPPDELDTVRRIVADGGGRGRVARELALSEHEARKLLGQVSTNGAGR